MEFCVVCDRRTTLAFHVCSGRAIYSIGPQGSYDMSAETLTSLAWVGDAEITLFVREALLARGIMDTGYFQELTSGEAQVAMYNLLSKEDRTQWCHPQMRPGPKGKRKSGDFLSTLYEALWASDFHFRQEAQALLVAYIRARTGPFGGDFFSLKQVASGPVVANSHLWRLNSRSPLTGSLKSTSCRKVVTDNVYAILGSEQFTIHGSSLDQFKKCVFIGSKVSSDTVFTRILKYWSNVAKQQ